jgi:hypothetical protein
MGWYFLYFMTSHHFYLFLLISQNKRQERAAGALETAAPFGDSFFLFTPRALKIHGEGVRAPPLAVPNAFFRHAANANNPRIACAADQ